MKRRIIIFLVVATISAEAYTKEPVPPSRLWAEFEMGRTIAALQDELKSSGILALGGPGLLRWETRSPSKSTLIVNGGKAWIHYPDLGVTKSFDLGQDPVMKVMSEHLLALSGGDFVKIATMYDMEDLGKGKKRLVPKQKSVRDVFKEMRVVLTPQGVASRVSIVSKTGDVTTITFRRVKTNDSFCPTATACAKLFEKPQ